MGVSGTFNRGIGRAFAGLMVLVLVVAAGYAASASGGIAQRGKPRLAVSVKAGKKRVTASVDAKPTYLNLGVTLNGHAVTPLFGRTGKGADGQYLGRREGLKYGENVLVARAGFPDGKHATKRVTFTVAKRGPLPSAGPDHIVRAGDKVKLDARASRHYKAKQLKYRWKLVRKPRGSHPFVNALGTARPVVRPDVPGTYLLEARVKSPDGVTRIDRAQVEAHDSQFGYAGPGVTISSIPLNGSGPSNGLRIYNGSNSSIYQTGGAGKQFVLLLWDRQTFEQLSVTYLANTSQIESQIAAAVSAAQQKVAPLGHDLLAAIQGQVTATTEQGIENALGTVGVPGVPGTQLGGDVTGNSIAGIGAVGGSENNLCDQSVQAWRGCAGRISLDDDSPAARLVGLIAPDTSDNYAFSQLSDPTLGSPHIGFDTQAQGSNATTSVIKVGLNSYTQTMPAGTGNGGFHVLVLDAATLNMVTNSFFQLSDAGTASTGGYGEMLSMLDAQVAYAQNAKLPQARLVFISPLGVTNPQNETGTNINQRAAIAKDIAALGGSANAFYLNKAGETGPGYALVGESIYAPSTSSAPNGSTGGGATNLEYTADSPPYTDVSTGKSYQPPPRLTGYLLRDTYWLFQAAGGPGTAYVSDPTSPGAFALSDAAFSVDTDGNPALLPTLYPHEGDPAWQAALQYAAKQLGVVYDPTRPGQYCYQPAGGVSDIRSSYCGGSDAGKGTWTELGQQLAAMAYPGDSAGFGQAVWSEMKTQLINREFPLVDSLNAAVAQVQRPYGAGDEIQAELDLEDISSYINQQVNKYTQANAPQRSSATFWLGLVTDLAWGVGGIASGGAGLLDKDALSDVITAVSSFIAGGLGIGGDFAAAKTGVTVNAPLLGGYTVANLGQQLAQRMQLSSQSFGVLRDLIAADWGKLQAWGAGTATADFSTAVISQTEPSFRLASQQHIWSQLVPAGYGLNSLSVPGGIPSDCRSNFAKTPANSWVSPLYDNTYLLLRPDVNPNDPRALVPGGLLDPLFEGIQMNGVEPVVATSGAQTPLGFNQDQWYTNTWNEFRSNVTSFKC